MEKDDNNDEAKKSYPLEQKSMTEEPKKKEKQKPMIDEEHIPIEVQRIIDNYKKKSLSRKKISEIIWLINI